MADRKLRRKSTRLQSYDYRTAGAYFVTICTYDREPTFGQVVNESVILSPAGLIVQEEWIRTPQLRPGVELDQFVVMQNHVYGIVVFHDDPARFANQPDEAHGCAPLRRSPRSLSSLIAGYKSSATKKINRARGMPRMSVWQRNYYEHVIRNDQDLDRIHQYIANNPAKWQEDEYYHP